MAKFNFGKGNKRNSGSAGDANSDDASGNSVGNSGQAFNPENAISGNVDGNDAGDPTANGGNEPQPAKRRGRPPGSKNKSSGSGSNGNAKGKISSPVNTGIEKTLVSLHMIAATLSGIPELALEDQEAAAIAEGIANVNEHYNIPGIDEGPAAIVMLAGTLLAIYGKRWLILRNQKTPSKNSSNKKEEDSNVSQFPMGSAPGSMFGLGAA